MSFTDTPRAPRRLTRRFRGHDASFMRYINHALTALGLRESHYGRCRRFREIGKPTVYCLLSQLLTHTPYITANPIQPSPPNRPSAKSFFVCPPHSHFHIYKWPALSRQLASPPVVSVDVYFILIELLTTVCIQAKRPVNNSLPNHWHVRLPYVSFFFFCWTCC